MWEEKACACVQPAPGSDLTFKNIIIFLKRRGVSVLHLPEWIEFVETMPLTKTGKIEKQSLVRDTEREIGSGGCSQVSTTD